MINTSPHRRQLRLVMLNGITLAGFNLVDIKKLHETTKLPVIALTREKPDLDSIYEALKNLPKPRSVGQWFLKQEKSTNSSIEALKFMWRSAGISLADAQKIIELTSTRSSVPEPLRVAHLIASGISP